MKVLALEASTSSAKAAVYEEGRGIVAQRVTVYPGTVCDVVSQNGEGVYGALVESARAALDEGGRDIDVVSLCGIWPSLALLDGSGRCIAPILTWADTSASSIAQQYKQDAERAWEIYYRTGCPVHSTFGLWKYLHLKEERPDLLNRAQMVTTQAGFLSQRFIGLPVASRCAVSASGMLNIHTLDWDERALALMGIGLNRLPELTEPHDAFPMSKDVAKDLGLFSGTPVAVGGADGALNQIGQGGVAPGVMSFSVGTSGAIRLAVQKPILPRSANLWCHAMAEDVRLSGVATSGAGNCVQWFTKTLLGGRYDYAALERELVRVDRVEAPVFLPFLYGERGPGWRDDQRGGFVGVEGSHGVAEHYYALLEGILMNIYHCYTLLTEREKPERIVASGGIEASPFWLQMAADILQMPLELGENPHSSIMGAVAIGLRAAEAIPTYACFRTKTIRTVNPNPEMKDFYAQRFQRYLGAYRKL